MYCADQLRDFEELAEQFVRDHGPSARVDATRLWISREILALELSAMHRGTGIFFATGPRGQLLRCESAQTNKEENKCK